MFIKTLFFVPAVVENGRVVLMDFNVRPLLLKTAHVKRGHKEMRAIDGRNNDDFTADPALALSARYFA